MIRTLLTKYLSCLPCYFYTRSKQMCVNVVFSFCYIAELPRMQYCNMAQSFIDTNSLPPEFCFSLSPVSLPVFLTQQHLEKILLTVLFVITTAPEKMPLLLLLRPAFGCYCSYHHHHIDFPFISV